MAVKNLDAYTAPNPDYPEFISINEKKETVEITVRGPKKLDGKEGNIAMCAMPKAEFKGMLEKILGRLK